MEGSQPRLSPVAVGVESAYTRSRMRRSTDPRTGVLAGCIGGAILLHAVALAGGSAIVTAAGGFGLAFKWQESGLDRPVELELDSRPVVELERPASEALPDHARFSSEWNSKVDRETAAKTRGLDPQTTASLSQKSTASADELPTPPLNGTERPPGSTDDPQQPSPLEMRPGGKEPLPDAPGAPNDSPWNRKLSLRSLRPSDGVLQQGVPSAFPDYLKDVEEGTQTFLNTKEFKFASFFNRVKRLIAQHWNPGREYELRDPKGNVYGFKSRYTVLLIVLDASGGLLKIVLDQSSGLGFLDDEAIRATRKAAPFSNPPRRLVDPRTRQVTFRFGFVFEIINGPSFRLFRLK
jgi:TonB family protein